MFHYCRSARCFTALRVRAVFHLRRRHHHPEGDYSILLGGLIRFTMPRVNLIYSALGSQSNLLCPGHSEFVLQRGTHHRPSTLSGSGLCFISRAGKIIHKARALQSQPRDPNTAHPVRTLPSHHRSRDSVHCVPYRSVNPGQLLYRHPEAGSS